MWWKDVLEDFRPPTTTSTPVTRSLEGPDGRYLLFLKVPEAKPSRTACTCLRPTDRTRDEEIERLLGLGATLVNDLRKPDRGWAVLADPEGNGSASSCAGPTCPPSLQ